MLYCVHGPLRNILPLLRYLRDDSDIPEVHDGVDEDEVLAGGGGVHAEAGVPAAYERERTGKRIESSA